MTREEALALSNNGDWKKLQGEITAQIEASKEEMVSKTDTEDIFRLQERIKALRFCFNLPMNVAEREE